jgi:penicillin-binding protein 1C
MIGMGTRLPPRPADGGRRFLLRAYAALLGIAVLVNAGGLSLATLLERLGPLPIDNPITYSPLVVDRDGKLLRPFITKDGYWRLPASPADVDPRFLTMLVAYEDKRFYTHPGVDPAALVRATLQAVWHRRIVSGASTLTMQVARLLEPRPERTLGAKLIEIVRAIQLEQRLSKQEILGLYLVLAPYGGNLEGIRAASLAYFGKEPKRLSSAEAALLIALPQAPEVRRPDRNAGAARAARDRVLSRLEGQGTINSDQSAAGTEEEMPWGRKAFPMFAAHLAERLIKVEPGTALEQTTISRPLQASLETLARERAQAIGGGVSAAIVIIDNRTAEVLAHVGGVGYFDGERAGQVDLAQALRSPGSALKPFIYGLAFEDGLVHPETLIDDRPVRFGAYAPQNFDDDFHGTVTVRRALQQSLNVPALAVLDAVGPQRLLTRLRNAGVDLVLPKDAPPGLAVGLGGVGIRLVDLAALYTAIARGGEALPLVWRAEDRTKSPSPRRLFDPQAAWQVGDVLLGAPVPENSVGGKIAFKTGTSYGYRDAWAVGFDGAYTAAVWVGRPDGSAVAGLIGRVSAAPILFEAFQRLSQGRAPLPPAPSGTVFARTSDLPPPLQRFRPRGLPEIAAAGPGDPPLTIAFPPDGSRVAMDEGADGGLALKANGGAPPFTWLVDGLPVVTGEVRREAYWEKPGRGFAHLSVIDAKGATANASVKVE